ncbi:glycophorin A domain protein [Aspergillus oryzae 100-8]|uniref:Glycophorin A domain protein n=2 Tax=Aspergillus subgen. Circumdati TaxID=2720871 RepID=A0AB74CE75_ASPFL|nr:glycophorin A domain protein [Aspergillus oryzae 3.042]KDE81921.1 glycophorin A domain protein [Aspergillus oryzae 100-8]RMZ44315.1 glycophorin A domain protein [Aspergillus flavus]|eukprot:EIT75510.1 glycophorin A domain protein [Aspergillus oryzae 3.042]
MVSYDPPFGYSLRVNGSCPERTKQCRATWDDFVACCPSESTCKVSDNNKNPICCPNEADCREPLFRIAHCANASWTMYEHYGLFCCKEEDQGFWTSKKKYNDSVGCAKQPEGASHTILNPIVQTISSTTFTYPRIATSTSTATSTSASAPHTSETSTSDYVSSSDDDPRGAIAGIVVGCVAGVALIAALAWYLLRRRRQKKQFGPGSDLQPPPGYRKNPESLPQGELTELPSSPPSQAVHEVHELPETTETR